ncbi:MAG: hypothetical protein HQL27_06980 [Candidatus Omnitrophica bacterium]|nr:hypothetical protein [Candidatus Omnitrophota bacterium]
MEFYFLIGFVVLSAGFFLWMAILVFGNNKKHKSVEKAIDPMNSPVNRPVEKLPPVVSKQAKAPTLTEHLMKENLSKPFCERPARADDTNPPAAAIEKAESSPMKEMREKIDEPKSDLSYQDTCNQILTITAERDAIKEDLERLKAESLKSGKEFNEKIYQLTKERDSFSDALKRELSSRQTKTLALEEQNLLKEKEVALKASLSSLQNLTEENLLLKKRLEEGEAQLSVVVRDLNNYKDELNKVRYDLSNAQSELSASSEIIMSARKLTERLEAENRDIKAKLDKVTGDLDVLNKESIQKTEGYESDMKVLREERETLQNKYTLREDEVADLKSRLALASNTRDEKLKEADQIIASFNDDTSSEEIKDGASQNTLMEILPVNLFSRRFIWDWLNDPYHQQSSHKPPGNLQLSFNFV